MSGVDPIQYWDLTLYEINAIINAYTKRQEQRIVEDYNLASMISGFIGCSFEGKDIPSIYDLYPDLESNPKRIQDEDALAISFYKDQFIAYAEKYNAQRKEK